MDIGVGTAGVQHMGNSLQSDVKTDNVARAACETVPTVLNALRLSRKYYKSVARSRTAGIRESGDNETHQIRELGHQPLTHLDNRERVPETGKGQLNKLVPVLDAAKVAPMIDRLERFGDLGRFEALNGVTAVSGMSARWPGRRLEAHSQLEANLPFKCVAHWKGAYHCNGKFKAK
jgi:hypothetical protein